MDRRFVVLLCVGLAFALSGCFDLGDGDNRTDDPDDPVDGDDGDDPDGQPNAPLEVRRTVEYLGIYGVFNLEYTDRIEVPSESMLTLTFDNQDANPLVVHDWYLPELDVRTERISGDETASVTFFVDLSPGEYVYYCSVGDHRNGGMEGTLVVTEYVRPSGV